MKIYCNICSKEIEREESIHLTKRINDPELLEHLVVCKDCANDLNTLEP